MKCWLYDEGGWPSGGACGKVLLKHPKYAKRILRSFTKVYGAGEIYRKLSESYVAAFINNTSSYKGVQDLFDRDTLDSGLFGPVILLI